MLLKPSHALLAALALIAAPAFAQDAAPAGDTASEATPEAAENATPAPDAATTPQTATETATESETAAEADAATDETTADAPADAPATPAEPRLGSYYLMAEHGDWTLRCIRTDQPKDPCEMYKLLVDEDDNAVAEMTLIPLTNGNVSAGATLIAPLETDLTEGLGLQIDNGEMRGYPFSVCTELGCMSRLGFTEPELAAMKRGNRATVQLLPFGGDPQSPVRLTASLSGFTAAFDALEAYAEAPVEEAPATDADADAEEDAPAE